jgi:Secretory lipase
VIPSYKIVVNKTFQVAVGGLVPNMTNSLSYVSGSSFAVNDIAGLLGTVTQYPDAEKYLLSKLKSSGSYNQTTFLSIRNLSFIESESSFGGQNIFDYFIDGKADVLAPIMLKIFNSNAIMGYHGVPQMPLYVYKAILDELSPVADTDMLVDSYCVVGANILYQRNTLGGHSDEYYNGDIPAFEWLSRILDGTWSRTYPSQVCTIQNVTVGTVNTGD